MSDDALHDTWESLGWTVTERMMCEYHTNAFFYGASNALVKARARITELEHRLFPTQGENYHNEVERLRVIVDGLTAAGDSYRARITQLETQLAGAWETVDTLLAFTQTVQAKNARLERELAEWRSDPPGKASQGINFITIRDAFEEPDG
jgi:hypothetical protein